MSVPESVDRFLPLIQEHSQFVPKYTAVALFWVGRDPPIPFVSPVLLLYFPPFFVSCFILLINNIPNDLSSKSLISSLAISNQALN